MKDRLIIDMDEVIADTIKGIIKLYNTEFECLLTKETLIGKRIEDVVPKGHIKSIKEYPTRLGFYKNLEIIENSTSVIQKLSKKYEVYIVSACISYSSLLPERIEWLQINFPFIPISNIVFCGDKSVIKGDIMIDDNDFNLRCFVGRKILFSAEHNFYIKEFERGENWNNIETLL